jgi:carbon storage regulator
MLVLTRKINQEIEIGENILIKVIAIRGNCVRIGVEAPVVVKVLRRELVGTPVRSESKSAENDNVTSEAAESSIPAPASDSTAPLTAEGKPIPVLTSRFQVANRISGLPRRNTLSFLVAQQRRHAARSAAVGNAGAAGER